MFECGLSVSAYENTNKFAMSGMKRVRKLKCSNSVILLKHLHISAISKSTLPVLHIRPASVSYPPCQYFISTLPLFYIHPAGDLYPPCQCFISTLPVLHIQSASVLYPPCQCFISTLPVFHIRPPSVSYPPCR